MRMAVQLRGTSLLLSPITQISIDMHTQFLALGWCISPAHSHSAPWDCGAHFNLYGLGDISNAGATCPAPVFGLTGLAIPEPRRAVGCIRLIGHPVAGWAGPVWCLYDLHAALAIGRVLGPCGAGLARVCWTGPHAP